MKVLLLSIILLFCAVSAPAETAITGPVAGFVFDQQARALRPMLGVPGAAYLGGVSLADLDSAAIAPGGGRALAVREGAVFLVTRLGAGSEAVPIEGAIPGARLMSFSADGSTAAIYSPESRRAQVLRNLAKTPAAGEAIDLAALPGEVTALAAAGEDVLIGIAAEQGGGIYLCAAGAAPRLLAEAAAPSALILHGRDAWFTDRARSQVWQVRNFAEEATPLLFADVDAPVGLQLAGKRLYVAGAGSRTLDVFDLDARAAAERIELEFTPATLAACGEKPLWLMNAAGGEEPLYVLEGGDRPAVYFVPAGREE